MFSLSSVTIPPRFRYTYRIARVALYAVTIVTIVWFSLRVLFPTLTFSFNFRTPDSSKNNLLTPRTPENTTRKNGKLETGGTLIADAGVTGNFSRADITLTLEKKSVLPQPDRPFTVSLRRSYRSFFLPDGAPITSFPEETIYRAEGVSYALRDDVLYPFVSDAAFRSRYPENFATEVSSSFLGRYPRSEEWIGFRVGSLLSFADGVFVVVSETEMRPIGSADIFLALGYDFKDVVSASEEEIGIYKRGKIFLLSDVHPKGTLLFDQDTKTYFLVDNGTKRPITDTYYRDFLLDRQFPISVSSGMSEVTAKCSLTRSLFGRSFSCLTSLDAFRDAFGNDFEIRVINDADNVDIRTLSVSFVTDQSRENMLFVLSQIKERLLARFGLSEQ